MKKLFAFFWLTVFASLTFASMNIADFSNIRFGKTVSLKKECQLFLHCMKIWSNSVQAMIDSFVGQDYFFIEQEYEEPATAPSFS